MVSFESNFTRSTPTLLICINKWQTLRAEWGFFISLENYEIMQLDRTVTVLDVDQIAELLTLNRLKL